MKLHQGTNILQKDKRENWTLSLCFLRRTEYNFWTLGENIQPECEDPDLPANSFSIDKYCMDYYAESHKVMIGIIAECWDQLTMPAENTWGASGSVLYLVILEQHIFSVPCF